MCFARITSVLHARIALVALVALVAIVAGSVAGYVAAQVPATFITACLNSRGVLYNVAQGLAPSGACKSNDVQISWSSNADITAVVAGDGLIGGATSGEATLSVNYSVVDGHYFTRTGIGSCAPGSSIRAINPEGTVICETDDAGTSTGSGGKLRFATRWSTASFHPCCNTWTTVGGSQTTAITEGGPLLISTNLYMFGGSHGTCQPVIDGVWAGSFSSMAVNGDPYWKEGLIAVGAVGGWHDWTTAKVYPGVPAGSHTFLLQCVTDGWTLQVNDSIVFSSWSVIELQ